MSRALDFGHLVDLCRRTHEETRRSAARAADTYLVTRNWLFGWYIVEYEDGGADRSTLYGKNLIARLSDELKAGGLKGCSPTNLRKFREFYRADRGGHRTGRPDLPNWSDTVGPIHVPGTGRPAPSNRSYTVRPIRFLAGSHIASPGRGHCPARRPTSDRLFRGEQRPMSEERAAMNVSLAGRTPGREVPAGLQTDRARGDS